MQKVRAGAQKSGGAAALPAPPLPRSLRERSTQCRDANSFITEMAVFTLETDRSHETGYLFDNSRQIDNMSLFENWMVLILNEQSAWLYPQILTGSLKMDYPFQIACVQPPPPLRKKTEKGVCGGGGDCTQARSQTDNAFSSSSVKTANNKIPVSGVSVFNDTERTVQNDCLPWLVRRPHYSARLMHSGSRGPSEFFLSGMPPKCLDRDCVGRRRTETRHGNVYRTVKEKQGIVVYR